MVFHTLSVVQRSDSDPDCRANFRSERFVILVDSVFISTASVAVHEDAFLGLVSMQVCRVQVCLLSAEAQDAIVVVLVLGIYTHTDFVRHLRCQMRIADCAMALPIVLNMLNDLAIRVNSVL